MRTRIITHCTIAVIATMMLGCARVHVQRVDHDEAVGPSGIRFYRTRPYVVVNEPFIVDADPYLVDGLLTPDGRYVRLINIDPDSGLGAYFASKPTDISVKAEQVVVREPGEDGGEQAEVPTIPREPGPKTVPGDGETQVESGRLNYKVVNDNGAYAVTPMRRYFDILWLPDFEEDYVVEAKSGLGNASTLVALGQGWSLQGVDASVDNSELTKRIFSLYDKSIEIALKVGQRALLGPAGVLAGGVAPGGEQALTADAVFEGGTELSIKVTVVRVVAPGVYPILKPNEVEYLKEDGRLAQLRESFGDSILVPVPPLTVVAYNTYDVIVLEASRADNDSPLRLHQYVLGQEDTTPGALPRPEPKPLSEARAEADADLKRQEADPESFWELETLTPNTDGSITAAVLKVGSPTLSEPEIVDSIKAALHGTRFADAEVKIEQKEPESP